MQMGSILIFTATYQAESGAGLVQYLPVVPQPVGTSEQPCLFDVTMDISGVHCAGFPHLMSYAHSDAFIEEFQGAFPICQIL